MKVTTLFTTCALTPPNRPPIEIFWTLGRSFRGVIKTRIIMIIVNRVLQICTRQISKNRCYFHPWKRYIPPWLNFFKIGFENWIGFVSLIFVTFSPIAHADPFWEIKRGRSIFDGSGKGIVYRFQSQGVGVPISPGYYCLEPRPRRTETKVMVRRGGPAKWRKGPVMRGPLWGAIYKEKMT